MTSFIREFFITLYFIILFSLTFLLELAAQTEADTLSKDQSKSVTRAIIIGISQYPNLSLEKQLHYADKDAKGFYEYLISRPNPVDSGNIKLLINKEATYYNLYTDLYWISEASKPLDEVIFFISGHGAEQDLSETGYLLLHKVSKEIFKGGETINMDELVKIMNKMAIDKNVKVYLYADACRSGNLMFSSNLVKNLASVNKILSCKDYQNSREYYELKNGVFTYYLLKGLYGMADGNNDNIVEGYELCNYLGSEISIYTKGMQVPICETIPKESISYVDPILKMKYGDDRNIVAMTNDIINEKGEMKNDKLDIDSSISRILVSLNNAIIRGNLVEPENENAWYYYNRLINEFPEKYNEELNEIKYNLIKVSLKDAQYVMNRYLEGENNQPDHQEFSIASKEFKEVVNVLGDDHILSNSLKAKQLFCEASYIMDIGGIASYEQCLPLLQKSIEYDPNAAYTYNLLGGYESFFKRFNLARNYIEEAMKIAPRWIFPRVSLAKNYLYQGMEKEALDVIDSILIMDSLSAYGNMMKGYFYFYAQNYRDYELAEKYLWKAIELSGINSKSSAEYYLTLGWIKKNQNEYNQERNYYKQGVELDSLNHRLYVHLGLSYLNQEILDSALIFFNKALALTPNDPELLTGLAQYYELESKNLYLEIEDIKNKYIVKLDFDNSTALINELQGELNFPSEITSTVYSDYTEDTNLDTISLNINDNNFSFELKIYFIKEYFGYNSFNSEANDFILAKIDSVENYHNILILKWSEEIDSSESLQMDLGITEYKIRQQALEDMVEVLYKRSIEYNPRYFTAYVNLYNFYSERGEGFKAVEILLMADSMIYQSPEPSYYLGNIYFIEQLYEKAEKYYLFALSIAPNYIDAHKALFNLYNETSQYQKLEKKADSLQNHSPELLCYLGDIYLGKELYNKSEKYYLSALSIAPDYIDAYSKLLDLYDSTAQYQKFVELYKEYFKAAPITTELQKKFIITYFNNNLKSEALDVMLNSDYSSLIKKYSSGDYEDAYKIAEGIRLNSKNSYLKNRALNLQVSILLEENELDKALELLKSDIKNSNVNSIGINLGMALILWQLEKKDEAINYLKQAFESAIPYKYEQIWNYMRGIGDTCCSKIIESINSLYGFYYENEIDKDKILNPEEFKDYCRIYLSEGKDTLTEAFTLNPQAESKFYYKDFNFKINNIIDKEDSVEGEEADQEPRFKVFPDYPDIDIAAKEETFIAAYDKFNKGEFELAEELFSESFNNNYDYDALLFRGLSKYFQGYSNKAKEDFLTILLHDSTDYYACINAGNCNYNKQSFEEAERFYNKAVILKPGNSILYYNRGLSKACIQNYEASVEDFTKALELNPLAQEIYYIRGLAKDYSNDMEGAAIDYLISLDLEPQFTEALNHCEIIFGKF